MRKSVHEMQVGMRMRKADGVLEVSKRYFIKVKLPLQRAVGHGELDRAGAPGFFRDRLRGKEGTMPSKIVARKCGL
jgi:hypothetical protein